MLWVVISLLDDNLKKLAEIKYAKYVAYGVSFLKLNKDLLFMLEYRNRVSICAILIKKGIGKITDRNSLLNRYAFSINFIYASLLLVGNVNCKEKEIVDYNNLLVNAKVTKIRERPVKNYVSLFNYYCSSTLSKIEDSLMWVGDLIYYSRYQQYYKLDAADLLRLEKLIEISYLFVKLMIFYLWNVLKLAGKSELEFLNYLIIPRELALYNLTFNGRLV
jgi:hypothetical protein